MHAAGDRLPRCDLGDRRVTEAIRFFRFRIFNFLIFFREAVRGTTSTAAKGFSGAPPDNPQQRQWPVE
jgi:hypothetical protein